MKVDMKGKRKKMLYFSIALKILGSLFFRAECLENTACVRNFGFPDTFYTAYSEYFSLFPPSFNLNLGQLAINVLQIYLVVYLVVYLVLFIFQKIREKWDSQFKI